MKTFHTMVMSGALALTLVGCGEEAPPPAPAVAAPKPVAAEVPKPKPAETAAASTYVYNYNPVGKRDPFRSPVEEVDNSGNNVAMPTVSCNEPLCQWDIDQLRLVAVVTGDANPLAMVEDPMGRGHIVRRNTRMGRQGGKVTQILRDEVIVTETITTPERVISNPVKLGLKQDDRVDPAYNLMTGKNWEP